MSEIFNSFYDDIFVQNDNDSKKELLNDKINNSSKKYVESAASLEDKKFFLKLKKEYFKIKNIKDYKGLQNKLYFNMNKRDIISFETFRILNSSNVDDLISEQVANIRRILSLNDGDLSDELYNKIINFIIVTELSLDVKVGLFNELCNFFENKIEMIEQESLSYVNHTKKK